MRNWLIKFFGWIKRIAVEEGYRDIWDDADKAQRDVERNS